MIEKKKIIEYLTRNNIRFQIIDHPAIFTVEEAKERENIIPGMLTKNIFIRDKKNNFSMITLDAHKKLDTKLFKLQAGISDFSFATPEELQEQIHITPGSVGIFGLLYNPSITLFIDQDIRSSQFSGRHPNENTSTVILEKDGLLTYLKVSNINYKVIIL